MSRQAISILFVIAGLYDGLIGLAFLALGPQIFDAAGVPQPNHWGYIQFSAVQLIIFGAMFFAVARDPQRHCNLIPFGILLKLGYVGIVAFYFARGECPLLFQPFAVADAVMFFLFLAAYRSLSPARPA